MRAVVGQQRGVGASVARNAAWKGYQVRRVWAAGWREGGFGWVDDVRPLTLKQVFLVWGHASVGLGERLWSATRVSAVRLVLGTM